MRHPLMAALAAGIAVSIPNTAPAASGSIPRLLQTNWQAGQGLPSCTVTAITQTRDGYLWLGSKRGLLRFDGSRFVLFGHIRLPHIRDSAVSVLMEAADGTLWVGGERGGIACYRDGRFQPAPPGVPTGDVTALFQAPDGAVWIGTPQGFTRVAGGKAEPVAMPPIIQGGSYSCALEDRRGRLWIGTFRAGLACIEGGRAAVYNTAGGLPDNQVLSVHEDRAGTIWAGTGTGLARLRGFRFEGVPLRPAPGQVRSIIGDRDGDLWIGSRAGVFRIGQQGPEAIPLNEGGPAAEIFSLYQDREKNTWVGTKNHGLFRLSSARVSGYSREDGLSSDSAKAILEARDGTVWVGTDAGLNRIRAGRAVPCGGPLATANIRSLAQAPDGTIWIATGRTLFRHTKRDAFEQVPGSPRGATSLWVGRDGTVWVGTGTGLFRYQDGSFDRFTGEDGLRGQNVWALMEDREGSLWVATSGALNRYQGGRFGAFTTQDGLASQEICSLYQDDAGAIWMGSMDHGISRWKNGRFTAITADAGLFEDSAFQILEDGAANLWISGSAGIYRVSKRELEEYAAGARASVSYVAFGQSDGMRSVECHGGNQPAGCKTRDGRLWFPTLRGVAVIDPVHLDWNGLAPQVAIEQVTANGRAVAPAPFIRIPPGEGRLEIQYTGLSLVDARKVRFRYRLGGFDRNWVEAGTRRAANYTNLPPGDYSFQVLACNNDGVWNTAGATLALKLNPHFHQTPWFYGLCATAALGMAWLVHRRRLVKAKATFTAVLSERARIAREIHDTIMQGVTGISAQLEATAALLESSPAQARSHLERVRGQARAIVDDARRSIWDLRPGELDGDGLLAAIRSASARLIEGQPVSLEVNAAGSYRPLSGKMEGNLLRIAQEAVANAVRHAGARHVQVALRFEADRVSLTVKDDGHGFDPGGVEAGPHFGMLGMRERAGEIGGRFTIRSEPGRGTELEVAVPL